MTTKEKIKEYVDKHYNWLDEDDEFCHVEVENKIYLYEDYMKIIFPEWNNLMYRYINCLLTRKYFMNLMQNDNRSGATYIKLEVLLSKQFNTRYAKNITNEQLNEIKGNLL